jgi:hypothetical protein
VETRSRHHLKFSVVRSPTKTFETSCLPITPIIDDDISITSKLQEFRLLEPIHYKHSGTYRTYHIPYCDLITEPIEFRYRIGDEKKHLEIIGVVLQNNTPKEILRLYNKYYFEKPKQLARNAWGCLLFASFQSNHHLTQPTTLHVSTKNIRNELQEITSQTIAPNNCFCPEWEIIHQAATLLQRNNTTISLPSQDRRDELEDILDEIISSTVQDNLLQKKEHIHEIQTPYLTIQHKRITCHYSVMIRHA